MTINNSPRVPVIRQQLHDAKSTIIIYYVAIFLMEIQQVGTAHKVKLTNGPTAATTTTTTTADSNVHNADRTRTTQTPNQRASIVMCVRNAPGEPDCRQSTTRDCVGRWGPVLLLYLCARVFVDDTVHKYARARRTHKNAHARTPTHQGITCVR